MRRSPFVLPAPAGARAPRRWHRSTAAAARPSPYLTPPMRQFVSDRDMMFLCLADGQGGRDCRFRAGPAGFVRVLGSGQLAWPERRAEVDAIVANPAVGLLFVDFFRDALALHVNGYAEILGPAAIRVAHSGRGFDPESSRWPECWVRVTVEEAYCQSGEYAPRLLRLSSSRPRGGDHPRRRDGDHATISDTPRSWTPRIVT